MRNYKNDLDSRNERLWNTIEREKPTSNKLFRGSKRKKVRKLRFRTTLDIDTNKISFVSRIVDKIISCENNLTLDIKYSSCKGVHMVLFCKKNCDLCRLVFDDFRRLAYDSNRPEYARNILFDSKEKIKCHIKK